MIRFHNAKILKIDEELNIIDGEVWTDNNKIVYVGEEKKNNEIEFEREINVKQNLIMPGFKNAHTHSPMTFLRSYADDLPLQEWLFKKVFPMEDKLTEEDVYYLSKLAILEYLTSGITSSFDMYFKENAYIQANIDMGYRTVLCGSVSGEESKSYELEENFLKYNNMNPLISYRLGFHAEYTANIELLRAISNLVHKYKAPLSTHNSETKKEVLECIERYGKTPTKLFDELGMYDYGGTNFHCVHVNEEDMQILKEKNISVITNPASNLKLASGIAPIQKMMNLGINIGIGTDGAASNNSLDMFKEMFLVTALQKYIQNDASTCPADKVLQMATINGARAMGLNNCEKIEEGQEADLIIIDLNMPNMQPQNDIIKNIIYSGSKSNVKLTMIAGKILYEDGKFYINQQPEEIYKKANDIIRRMESN